MISRLFLLCPLMSGFVAGASVWAADKQDLACVSVDEVVRLEASPPERLQPALKTTLRNTCAKDVVAVGLRFEAPGIEPWTNAVDSVHALLPPGPPHGVLQSGFRAFEAWPVPQSRPGLGSSEITSAHPCFQPITGGESAWGGPRIFISGAASSAGPGSFVLFVFEFQRSLSPRYRAVKFVSQESYRRTSGPPLDAQPATGTMCADRARQDSMGSGSGPVLAVVAVFKNPVTRA